MESKIKGIHNRTIGAYWTVFFLIFIFLVTIGIRVWLCVSPSVRYGPPEPVRIEGNLKPPRQITHMNPVYPKKAKRAGIKGKIQIEVKTNLEGNVESAKILDIAPSFGPESGKWSLYKPAREAVLKWTFEPYYYREHIRPAIFTVLVSFE